MGIGARLDGGARLVERPGVAINPGRRAHGARAQHVRVSAAASADAERASRSTASASPQFTLWESTRSRAVADVRCRAMSCEKRDMVEQWRSEGQ